MRCFRDDWHESKAFDDHNSPLLFYHYYFSDFIYRQGLSKANGQWPESRKYQQIGGNSVSCHKTTGKEAGIPSHSSSLLTFLSPLRL